MMLWSLLQTVRADLLERTRRYSFLVTLGAMVLAGYLAVPAVDSGILTVNLGQLRGLYNSAWIGGMIALLSSMMMSIPGFYLVKDSIRRDRATRVGQIAAATPLRKVPYLFGKALSNFLFLSLIIGLVMIAAAVMQLLRGEVTRVVIWDVLAPFLLVTLPTMAVVAGVAVFFECVRFLQGGFGNIAYFVLYLIVLIVSMSRSTFSSQGVIESPVNDLFGASIIGASMLQSAHAAYPERQLDLGIGYARVEGPVDTFAWHGVAWNGAILAQRALWVGVACLIVFVAALFFDRFDPARSKLGRSRRGSLRLILARVMGFRLRWFSFLDLSWLPLPVAARVLAAELRLMLREQPWWWHVAAVGLVIGGALTSDPESLRGILLASWILPVFAWSKLGVREYQNHTEGMVFSAPRPLLIQLPAMWLSGVVVAMLLGAGVGFRFLLDGCWAQVAAWCVGAIFIPTLALAAGVWSGTPKLFEAAYVVAWYVGPVSGLPELDFMGATAAALNQGMPIVYLGLSFLLLLLAILGRARQIHT